MKIEAVQSYVSGDLHFVQIFTDTGLVGLGQSAMWAYPRATEAVVDKISGYLLGKDPFTLEHHWQALYRMGPFRGAALSSAVSAIDIALWDIKAQSFEVPIYEILGGKYRDKVRLCLPVSASTAVDIVKAAVEGKAQGFTVLKLDPICDGFQDLSHARVVNDALDLVAEVRSEVGRDVDLILELHRKLTPLQAIGFLEGVAKYTPLFCEDPIQIDSLAQQAALARKVTVPIGNGERLHTIWEFNELLEAGGPQYLRPDIGLAGGFSHLRKIAAIGEARHSAVVTHNFLGPALTAASVHFDVTTPNFVSQEYNIRDEDAASHPALTSTLVREGGFFLAPQGPGLGVTLDPDKLSADCYLGYVGALAAAPLRDDGSVIFAV